MGCMTTKATASIPVMKKSVGMWSDWIRSMKIPRSRRGIRPEFLPDASWMDEAFVDYILLYSQR
jgi:hypothetical protein